MVKLVHEYSRVIAFVADLHVGSRYAVCPEEWKTETGVDLAKMMNAGQKQLLQSWKNFCNKCNKLQVDTVFVVGDAIAGVNRKEYGLHLMTTDINEQLVGVCNLLEPLVVDRELNVLSGTVYHGSVDVRVHEYIAKEFGGCYLGNIVNYKVKEADRIINVAHTTTSATVYPETAFARDIMFEKEAEALGKMFKVNAIVRGHRHMFAEIHKHDLHYVSLPAWQAFVPYEKAVRWYFQYQPDIGGVILFVDEEGRFRFWHFLYPCPHIADKVVIG